jgi:hypothetical protein
LKSYNRLYFKVKEVQLLATPASDDD